MMNEKTVVEHLTKMDRKNIFKPFGFETLIIWERELKNVYKLTEKISDFHQLK